MSGPCTLEYLLIQGTLLGAKAVLESARKVRTGTQSAIRQAADTASRRRIEAAERRAQQKAAARRSAEHADSLEAGLARIRSVLETLAPALGGDRISIEVRLPERPSLDDLPAFNRYAAALEAELARVRDELDRASAKLAAAGAPALDSAALARLAQPRSVDELLDAYIDACREERLDAMRSEHLRRARALLTPLGSVAALPAEVDAILRELATAQSDTRADALTLELRRLIGVEQARQRRQEVQDAQEAAQVAAAGILEGALQDLGFAVEPVEHTLFVEGGVAHFTRAEWSGYAVRLRASPTDGTLNFNVVREAIARASPAVPPADALALRAADARIEESWCAHIPRLMETLRARGIEARVARMLGAGEAPVQEVAPGTVPRLLEDPVRAEVTGSASRAANTSAEPPAEGR